MSNATTNNTNSLPKRLSPESVCFACDGPREQVIAELKGTIRQLNGWETIEADALRDEANDFLSDMGK